MGGKQDPFTDRTTPKYHYVVDCIDRYVSNTRKFVDTYVGVFDFDPATAGLVFRELKEAINKCLDGAKEFDAGSEFQDNVDELSNRLAKERGEQEYDRQCDLKMAYTTFRRLASELNEVHAYAKGQLVRHDWKLVRHDWNKRGIDTQPIEECAAGFFTIYESIHASAVESLSKVMGIDTKYWREMASNRRFKVTRVPEDEYYRCIFTTCPGTHDLGDLKLHLVNRHSYVAVRTPELSEKKKAGKEEYRKRRKLLHPTIKDAEERIIDICKEATNLDVESADYAYIYQRLLEPRLGSSDCSNRSKRFFVKNFEEPRNSIDSSHIRDNFSDNQYYEKLERVIEKYEELQDRPKGATKEELKKENETLSEEVRAQKEQVMALKEQVIVQKEQILAQKEEIIAQKEQVMALKEQVMDLTDELKRSKRPTA